MNWTNRRIWRQVPTLKVAVLVCLALLASCRAAPVREESARSAENTVVADAGIQDIRKPEIGFRTRRNLEEHFAKHGSEFPVSSQKEYLEAAQRLRDAPAGGDVIEAIRRDGVITRFDRKTGAFIAFDRDSTIKTFFKPNDGERYFRRQLSRDH